MRRLQWRNGQVGVMAGPGELRCDERRGVTAAGRGGRQAGGHLRRRVAHVWAPGCSGLRRWRHLPGRARLLQHHHPRSFEPVDEGLQFGLAQRVIGDVIDGHVARVPERAWCACDER